MSTEGAIQLIWCAVSSRVLQMKLGLSRAFSAPPRIIEYLGRCPRLELNRAVGAKQIQRGTPRYQRVRNNAFYLTDSDSALLCCFSEAGAFT